MAETVRVGLCSKMNKHGQVTIPSDIRDVVESGPGDRWCFDPKVDIAQLDDGSTEVTLKVVVKRSDSDV